MFSGFLPTDFAAYTANKWNSNAFTLERMKVKDKLHLLSQACADLVQGKLHPHLSDEFPNITNHKKVDAQWLFFSRGGDQSVELARFLERIELKAEKIFQLAAHEKNIGISIIVNEAGLRAGLMLHPGALVDRRNLAAKLHNAWDRERLLSLLQGTPLTISLGDHVASSADVSLESLEGLSAPLAEQEGEMFIGQHWSCEDAANRGAELGSELRALVARLLPAYEFAAWTRDNDHIQFGEKMRQEKKELRKQVVGLKAGDKVRVTNGLFAGKTGVIQSIESKALVRVLLGTMAVSIPSGDVVPT